MYDIIVAGAGTAGLTAAIYGVRAGKKVLVLESDTFGGQIVSTPVVENYPGIRKISGYEFASQLYGQALELGAEIEFGRVTDVRDGSVKKVVTEEETYEAKTLIIATGAKNRPLGVAGEAALAGRGVSYCAACDGAFYKGKRTAVVGGGNTALEDAEILSGFCEKVYLIHRRDNFRGDQRTLGRLAEKDNVEFIRSSRVVWLKERDDAEGGLGGVVLEGVDTKAHRALQIDGLFVAVGQAPQNGAFANAVALDEAGYVRAGESCETSAPGIFAAGDCRTKKVRQLATAAGDGAAAALGACEYIAAAFDGERFL